jgi:hypothetical protein
MTQYRDQWQAVVNLHVLYRMGSFLTSSVNISF